MHGVRYNHRDSSAGNGTIQNVRSKIKEVKIMANKEQGIRKETKKVAKLTLKEKRALKREKRAGKI